MGHRAIVAYERTDGTYSLHYSHRRFELERLLAEGVSKTKQADGEIHEDQLLNFLVNRLDEEVSLSLANNAEITAEDIYEVLVGACADRTSVSTLCASSQNSPAGNTVLYHLRTKFEPEQLERVANTPPAKGSR